MLSFYPKQSAFKDSFNDFKQKDYSAHKKGIYCIKWNHNGNYLASGSEDYTVKIWSHEKGGLDKICDFKDHTGSVEQLTWHPENPELLGTVSSDKTLKIWDIRVPKKFIKNIQTKGSNLNIAWSPDGNTIAVTNNEDYISFYDFRTQTIQKQIKFEREVNEISWDQLGNIFLITTSSESGTLGPIIVLDGKTLNYPGALETLDFHRGKCYCITMDPTGNYFATGAADAYVALWDLAELVPLKSFSKENCQVRQLSFSHDGRLIAAAAEDKRLDIYDIEGENEVWKIECNAPQLSVSWNPKKHLLAYTLEEKDKSDCSINLFGAKLQ